MKVIHIGTKTWPPRHGGVEKIVHDLVQAGDPGETWVLANDCEVETDFVRRLRRFPPAALWQVVRLARSQGVRLIHLHKEPSILLALPLQLLGFRCVLTLHGFVWRVKRWPLWQRAAVWLLDLLAYLLVRRVVFVSERDWRAVRRWLPLKRLRLVRNGVALPPKDESAPRDRDWVYLGRISPEKNVNSLIEAASSAGIRLDLFGALDERDKRFAARFRTLSGSPGIHWRGPLDFALVPGTLARYRVLVNLSFTEGLPVSVLEGAAQDLHLVLSDIPPHRVLGFPDVSWVDPGAPTLREITWRVPTGANREHVRGHYSAEAMIDGYRDIYEELVGDRHESRKELG